MKLRPNVWKLIFLHRNIFVFSFLFLSFRRAAIQFCNTTAYWQHSEEAVSCCQNRLIGGECRHTNFLGFDSTQVQFTAVCQVQFTQKIDSLNPVQAITEENIVADLDDPISPVG